MFTKLSQAQYAIPNNIQAMIVLSHLLVTMSVFMQLLVQTKDALEDIIAPTLDQIITTTILNWEQHTHICYSFSFLFTFTLGTCHFSFYLWT